MIVEQFGGLITCKSEWGKGTTFIFLIALDDSEDSSQEKDFRCRNPIKKVYQKIKINHNITDGKLRDILEENSFMLKYENENDDESKLNPE